MLLPHNLSDTTNAHTRAYGSSCPLLLVSLHRLCHLLGPARRRGRGCSSTGDPRIPLRGAEEVNIPRRGWVRRVVLLVVLQEIVERGPSPITAGKVAHKVRFQLGDVRRGVVG